MERTSSDDDEDDDDVDDERDISADLRAPQSLSLSLVSLHTRVLNSMSVCLSVRSHNSTRGPSSG